MIGRSVSAFKDARKTEALRHQVKSGLLTRVPFLEGASENLISDLATSLVAETLPAGAVVFAEGSTGDRFYLVGAGVARVSKGGEVISDLGPGGCFGEGALLSNDPRSATVTAFGELTLYALTRSSFEFLTGTYPKVRDQLRALHQNRRIAAISRTIQQELLGRVPFLHGASDALIADLAASLVPERVKAGAAVLVEGEAGDRFFLIEDGTVQISKAGVVLAELGKGGCLGEGALLSDEKRSATATAAEDTRLFSLSRDAFTAILARHDGVREAIVALHHKRRNAAVSAPSAGATP